ncbi:MAG TPA: PepSY domain-containing protein [Acetobacteraceae bacterium]|nr:PepSY domain-containing protein [Acetobacteraceae bacterium]
MRRIVLPALATLALATAPAAFAEQSCQLSGPPMSRAAMEKSLVAQGYTTIRSLQYHNGCYEAQGFDKNGKRFELELNASTGAINTQELRESQE